MGKTGGGKGTRIQRSTAFRGIGGGLTVIANAPNPAGQALLSRFFDGAISAFGLLAGAIVPTIIAAMAFRLI